MWQINTWQFRNHTRYLRSPRYISQLQQKLMKWTVAREAKGLRTDELHEAIYYLNEFKEVCENAIMLDEHTEPYRISHSPLPKVDGFISRI